MLVVLPLVNFNAWRRSLTRWLDSTAHASVVERRAATKNDNDDDDSNDNDSNDNDSNDNDSNDNDSNDDDNDDICCVCGDAREGAHDVRLRCRHEACHWCAAVARERAARCAQCGALVDFDDAQ